jgi:hypothetical protein
MTSASLPMSSRLAGHADDHRPAKYPQRPHGLSHGQRQPDQFQSDVHAFSSGQAADLGHRIALRGVHRDRSELFGHLELAPVDVYGVHFPGAESPG